MKSFNVHDAKTNFSALLAMVGLGEEIIISKAGEPIAVLVPYKKKRNSQGRKPGLFEGKIHLSEDFFAPMDSDFMKHFS
jgi:prevent-host-death family protein